MKVLYCDIIPWQPPGDPRGEKRFEPSLLDGMEVDKDVRCEGLYFFKEFSVQFVVLY